jgi:hypothetical protein
MENDSMKPMALELPLRRWPYGLEVRVLPNGLLLRPRRKARTDWTKSFRCSPPPGDDLASIRQLTNKFDAKELEW